MFNSCKIDIHLRPVYGTSILKDHILYIVE